LLILRYLSLLPGCFRKLIRKENRRKYLIMSQLFRKVVILKPGVLNLDRPSEKK